MEIMIIGGRIVPRIAVSEPITPAIRYPMITEAFTGSGPGADCVIAVTSSISSSSSHCSSSTNFFFIKDTMTNPPPNVHALSTNIDLNNTHSLLSVSYTHLSERWPISSPIFLPASKYLFDTNDKNQESQLTSLYSFYSKKLEETVHKS